VIFSQEIRPPAVGYHAAVRFSWPRALLALLAVVLFSEVVVISPHPGTAAVVASIIWIVAPGVVLARRAFGAREPSGIGAWLVGPALGFGIGVFGMLLIWAAGVQNWVAIAGGPLLTWSIAALAKRVGGPTLRLPVFDRRDIAAVAIAVMLVPAITWAPYAHVRKRVADGEAYRAYFTADFFWAMTVTAELAKGEVPPLNPFLRGERLHYYWMSHFLSGALYRNVRGWGMLIEQVLLLDSFAFSLAFVPFLYFLVRLAGANAVFAALAVMVSFVANSYEGANRLWIYHQQHAPLSLVKTLNIDAVTRWFYQGMPVDGLQRMLLYQPHHLTGYMMALASLWLVGFAEDVTETSVALWAGILLGLAFLFSTFTAIVVGAAMALLFAVRLLGRRAYRALWQAAILGGGPAILGVAASQALAYTDPRAGFLVIFGLNPVAVRHWALAIFLSFGPLLFAGIAGLARVRWVIDRGAAPFVLVLSAFAFYFFADVPNQEGVWVGWRAGHLLLICFSAIGAAALTAAWRHSRWRPVLAIALALAILPAVPTVAIDIYNAQDITNRGPGPSFPWTFVITPPEREALEWIRRATPPDAVVQYEPLLRGLTGAHWVDITGLAERRMAAGVSGAMIPFQPYEQAAEDVRNGIFRADRAADAHAVARRLGIDYLLVGTPERDAYAKAIHEIAAHPEFFPPVFDNGVVEIFGVAR